jgi:hypothetical protein
VIARSTMSSPHHASRAWHRSYEELPFRRIAELVIREFRRGRQHFRDHAVYIRIRREVIHDAGTQVEFSFQFCIRQVHIASAHTLFKQREIELISLLLGRTVGDQVAETDSAQFYWPSQFEFGTRLYGRGQALRLIEVQTNGVAKRLQAVESH